MRLVGLKTVDVGYLGDDFPAMEDFYQKILDAPSDDAYALDFAKVGFLTPANIIGLVIGARFLMQTSNCPVLIKNASSNILSYMERVDVFRSAKQWLFVEADANGEKWTRSDECESLLELTPILNENDSVLIVKKVNEVCQPLKLSNIHTILSIISELCQNAWEHSQDRFSMVMVQRYHQFKTNKTIVHISIGDFGIGVRQCLVNWFGDFAEKTSDYLSAALGGKTSRASQRGGLGLQNIERTVTDENGILWLRSLDGSILSGGPNNRRLQDNLAKIPGTQVTIQLEGPLAIESKLK